MSEGGKPDDNLVMRTEQGSGNRPFLIPTCYRVLWFASRCSGQEGTIPQFLA